MNWDDLKIFLAVAEAPSMRIAAKGLRISHSTVSRRIEALEGALGARLFDRLPDGYRLTRAGEELLPIALKTDECLHTFGRSVAGRDDMLCGQLRLTLPDPMLATGYFGDILIAFMRQYPDIHLRIDDSLQVFDLAKREADVAIRFTAAPPPHLIGRKLGTLHQAVYGARDYVAQHRPHDADSDARWIAWGEPDGCPEWIKETPFPHLKQLGHFNSPQIQLAMIKQGGGIGYIPCLMGDCQKDLVRLSEPAPTLDVWLLSHSDTRSSARMRVFRQFIGDRASEIEAALAGRLHARENTAVS
ncbi:LysR family transcriptional regulator [Kordiimonas gwangyangensis]|uniref:LysR family transcriptional regulator n=1 Tax=Kordiimonas gwangyangensis TaxID=288022 RepID=UPI000380F3B8|nr:LysR family transcriptional regulator [Kordiimonas gwangyangensis]